MREKLWLDVDLVECSKESVILNCGIDLTIEPEIEIRFTGVFFTCILATWRTDTSKPVLQVLSGDEELRLNIQYGVEQGHHLFAFQPDYLPDARCIIAAQAFSWKQLNESI